MTTPEDVFAPRSQTSRTAWALFLIVSALVVWAGVRVVSRERKELDYTSARVVLAETVDNAKTARLGLVTLERGDNVSFDVCTEHGFDRAIFLNAMDVAVWQPASHELLVRTAFDDTRLAHARRTVDGTCIEVAQGTAPASADYAIEAVWEGHQVRSDFLHVPMITRVRALRNLDASDKAPLWLGFGVSLILLAAVTTLRRAANADRKSEIATARLLTALSIFAIAYFGSALIPSGGATGAMVRGAFLALVQIVIAFSFVQPASEQSKSVALGWEGSLRNRWLIAPACFLFGGSLAIVNGVVTSRLVPSTSVAPIEALVSFPSARLAVGVIALLAPLSEELFFRGFVFGSVDGRWGRGAAWAASIFLFAIAHVPQTWGAWGSTVSIFITGVLLTAVRARTGSTAASMLTHLSHNALITLLGL